MHRPDPRPFRPARHAAVLLLAVLLLGTRGAGAEECAPATAAAGPTPLERGLTPSQLADLRFLQHLGWRFERAADVAEVVVHHGRPWTRDGLAQAQAAGDLRVLFPPAIGSREIQQFAALLPGLVDGLATRAAYQYRVVSATHRAASRLDRMTDKGQYCFPEILGLVHSPYFSMRLPSGHWTQEGRLFVGTGRASAAMQSIYDLGASVECYVGQLLLLYLIQYELYGASAFDEAFRAEELVVGRPPDWQASPIGLPSREADTHPYRALVVESDDMTLDPVLALAPFGPNAFVGLAGVVCSQDPEVNCNDNLVIVSASRRAIETMARGGGLVYVARQCKRIWEAEDRSSGLFVSSDVRCEADRVIESIYRSPVFSEILVYTHPYGIVPLAHVIHKKLTWGGAAVWLRIYFHGLEDAMFKRYRETWRRRTLRALGVAPPAPAPAGN